MGERVLSAEDQALADVVAAFERETGKQVEATLETAAEQPSHVEAALKGGRPPDAAFGFYVITYIPKWAFEDRLVDLTDSVGHFRTC